MFESWQEPYPSLSPVYKSGPGNGQSVIKRGTAVLESGEVFSPVMVLKNEALEHNLLAMAQYCSTEGVELAMHGKTSMSPELTIAQIQAGAWGVSAATPAQVRTFRAFGVNNVFLANELVDPAGIRWIAEYQAEHPESGFLCYIDSVAGVELLNRTVAQLQNKVALDVLIEVAIEGGRTGVRGHEDVLTIARAAHDAPYLRLVGVSGYEGALASDRSEASVLKIREYTQHIASVAQELDQAALFESDDVIISAGGGIFFELVVDELTSIELPVSRKRIIIRAGSYLSHDDGLYSRIAAFAQPESTHTLKPALELWGRVLSRPEPTLAFLDFGRRDTSFDAGLPTPLTARNIAGGAERPATGFTITALNDQHAYLTIPADDPLAPGDWVGSGISHPCTAFDKWKYLPVVDAHYRVVGSVTTYF